MTQQLPLRRREDVIHRNAWGWLISHLDAEILALATCSKRLPSERAYHWIIEASGQERHNRAQATQLMPYLIDYFLLEKPDYRQLCRQHGFEALTPLDHGETGPRKICEGNLELIRKAQMVVANLNPFRGAEPDSGDPLG